MIESYHFHLIKGVNKILSLHSEWSHISVKVHLLKIFLNSMCYKSFALVVVEYFALVGTRVPCDFLCNR